MTEGIHEPHQEIRRKIAESMKTHPTEIVLSIPQRFGKNRLQAMFLADMKESAQETDGENFD